MIAQSRAVMVGAVILATGVHLAGLQRLGPSPAQGLTAESDAPALTLGTGFADLAQGVMMPVSSASAPRTPARSVQAPAPSAAVPVTQQPKTASAMAAITGRAVDPVSAATVVAAAPSPVRAARPAQTAAQPEPVSQRPTAPAEVVTGEDISRTAPTETVRPSLRPDLRRPQPPRASESRPAETARQTAPNRTGAASAPSSAAAPVSDAAVRAYPGQVLQRIQRQQARIRTNARGKAVVRFSIRRNGTLASASIATSSGDARLDRTALEVVQRAAPFPPPPRGAQTSYRVTIGR